MDDDWGYPYDETATPIYLCIYIYNMIYMVCMYVYIYIYTLISPESTVSWPCLASQRHPSQVNTITVTEARDPQGSDLTSANLRTPKKYEEYDITIYDYHNS